MRVLSRLKAIFEKKEKSSNIPVIGKDIPYVSQRGRINLLKAMASDMTVDELQKNKDVLKTLVL
ncbi:hypothetical protein FL857_06090 [Criibacterium bergeronii]|uniref:Uncharacterized protein n=1 Tax=Criibacterium bergeronii TaxID=1871336 RepID=A0A552V717_9FIRM|nr:hypothetical protein [Criibacterium bergeronii]TRW26255.1 hypothetical protein FL857_06090 [Criibacterium bergeronii]